jgi:hypothetical protein
MEKSEVGDLQMQLSPGADCPDNADWSINDDKVEFAVDGTEIALGAENQDGDHLIRRSKDDSILSSDPDTSTTTSNELKSIEIALKEDRERITKVRA